MVQYDCVCKLVKLRQIYNTPVIIYIQPTAPPPYGLSGNLTFP